MRPLTRQRATCRTTSATLLRPPHRSGAAKGPDPRRCEFASDADVEDDEIDNFLRSELPSCVAACSLHHRKCSSTSFLRLLLELLVLGLEASVLQSLPWRCVDRRRGRTASSSHSVPSVSSAGDSSCSSLAAGLSAGWSMSVSSIRNSSSSFALTSKCVMLSGDAGCLADGIKSGTAVCLRRFGAGAGDTDGGGFLLRSGFFGDSSGSGGNSVVIGDCFGNC